MAGLKISALVDTGAARTLMADRTFPRLCSQNSLPPPGETSESGSSSRCSSLSPDTGSRPATPQELSPMPSSSRPAPSRDLDISNDADTPSIQRTRPQRKRVSTQDFETYVYDWDLFCRKQTKKN